MSVLYFFGLVGLLVLIHEAGHFAAAKLLDVKVLRFSIGYGRPLLRLRGRETEYTVGVFPLGGYVRILGVEGPAGPDERIDPRDQGRSFESRPLWQRLVIVFAGPAFNLVLPILIYFVFFAGHAELPAAVIGDVVDGGPAARAGLEPGDRVDSVDGAPVRYWEELEGAIGGAAGEELHLRLERGGKAIERYLVPVEEVVRKRDGQSSREGRIGVTRAPFVPLVGVLDRASPAGKAGLRTGDLIISLDGRPVGHWGDVARQLGQTSARTNLVYFRGTEVPGVPQVRLLEARFADLVPETRLDDQLRRTTYTGLEKAEMFVAQVDPGTPADLAGIRPGDLIVSLDGQPVHHWMALDQRLQAQPEKAWTITWKRAGGAGQLVTLSAQLTQVVRTQHDEYGHAVQRLVFGARNDAQRGRGHMVPIEGRFTYAVSKAVMRTGETIEAMVTGFVSILGGETPGDALGGPLMMYRVATVSGERGWESFLLMLALISVNLGLINLLPVPVLDGGHVLVFAVEAVRRRRLSMRMRERVQLAGLAVVGIITLLAVRNDVMRYLVNG
jgi:regulator of sigma E protease